MGLKFSACKVGALARSMQADRAKHATAAPA